MSQEWYYSVDGSQQGPVSAAELKKLATDGKLKPEDLVWKDGMAEWKAASTIKGLFGGGASSGGMPAPKAEEPKPEPARDERPSRRGRDEEEDRPRRRRDEEEEEDRPRNRRRDEEEDDRPSRRGRDDDDDRPSRRGRDDDDEDRPRKKSKRRIPEDTASRKMTAGLLAILIGGLGIHKFYLGMTGAGIIQIVLTFCTGGIAGFIPLIEGIIYLTKTDEDFHREYVIGQKNWF